ncbi:hypothetical protein GGI17_003974 [Coemansia sp. S146]|nr:hypothetical protein GGI17_003974 [Coemansia sp. S146]
MIKDKDGDVDDESDDNDDNESDDDYEAGKDVLANIAVVAVQIAVLCPNFRHVDLLLEMRSVFSREIALAMASVK